MGQTKTGILLLTAVLMSLPSLAQEPFNPASLLQGSSSGVLVSPVTGSTGEELSVLLRGGGGFRGASQPLWIVDGVEINPSVNFLNIYDIESIQVVKDYWATARYGGRGADGVVLVKTGSAPRDDDFSVRWNSDAGVAFPLKGIDGTRVGFNHNHYLSFLGSRRQTHFGISGWFRQLSGVEPRNDNILGGVRTFFDSRANSVLTFGMNSTFVMGRSNLAACSESFGNGSLTLLQRNPDQFPGQSISGWTSDYDNETQDKRFTTGAYVAANIGKFVKFRLDLGFDLRNEDHFVWYGSGTPLGKAHNGYATVEGNTDFAYNAAATLSFNKYFADRHGVSVDAVFDAHGLNTKRGSMTGDDFFTHTLRARGLNLYNGDPDIRKYEFDTFSYGGSLRAGYAFAEMAGLEGLFRIEHMPRYDQAPQLYKSLRVWFDPRKAFFPKGEAVSSLRLSGGYGEAGREKNLPYLAYGEYLPGTFPAIQADIQMFYEGLWRLRSREWTARLEAGFLSDRIRLAAGYFDRTADDGFQSYCFGEKDGYYWIKAPRSEHFRREARIAARGIEAEAGADILRMNNLRWSISATFAWNISRIVANDDADLPGTDLGSSPLITANVPGYPAASFYGYKTDASGAPVDASGDGIVNRFDRQVLGGSMPRYYGSAGTTFSYGAFSLDVLATWAAGFEILDLNRLLFDGAPDFAVTDQFLGKGDYLRLSRVRASYDIPLKGKSIVKAIQVSLSGHDLLTWSAYPRWNPAILGVDYGTCPAGAAVLLGVSLTFGRNR